MPLPRNVNVPTALIAGAVGAAAGALIAGPTVYVTTRDDAPQEAAPEPKATVTATATRTVTASPPEPTAQDGTDEDSEAEGTGEETAGPSAEGPDRESMTGWESVKGDDGMWGNATVDGTRRNGALIDTHYCGRDRTTEFNLGRDWTVWEAAVGIDDDADEADGSVSFEVVGDGERLAQATVGLGEEAGLEADVTDVLRLELVSISHGCVNGDAVWADPVLHA